ncbi:MAG: site-2 protease family protein [Gemmatimonadales bacterium]|nr:site-2 protease family protein [Gemmatimonadales bacterium]
MGWSFRIGRIAGTDVKVHITFLLLLVWFAVGSGSTAAGLDTVLRVLALFACVLLHEFGHIAAGRHYGIGTPDVILLPIGGVARLSRIPEEPRQELVIALGGPAVTLAIVLVLYGAIKAGLGAPVTSVAGILDGPFIASLLVANFILLVFNMIPAFPMDGGRVFRALLAMRMPYVRATRIAARVGQLFALAGGLFALRENAVGLLVVAAFIFLGATAESAAVDTRVAGRGMRVADMMVTDFRTLPIHAVIADAVGLLLAGEQREFPIVDNLGRYEGMLTREHLIRGLSDRGPTSLVRDAMATGMPAVSPELGFGEALGTLRAARLPALPVIDATGRLVGMLTMDNVTDLLLVRRAQGDAA